MPDFSYRYSYKVPDTPGFDSLPATVQDSLLYFNSGLVRYLDDQVLLETYKKSLSDGLRRAGFNVYTQESAEGFFNAGAESMVVNLVQLQFEEFYDSISDEVSFDEEDRYNFELFITALNLNSWFELSKVNRNDTATVVLYASQTITDYFDGGFRYFPFSGEVKYTYTTDSLTTGDVYRTIESLGPVYSGYLYDYLMNDYVQRNLPQGMKAEKVFTYDRQAGVVRKSKKPGFTRLR